MKFSVFSDVRMVGLRACGYLVSPMPEAQTFLLGLHQRRPFVKFKAKNATYNVHIRGGPESPHEHLHVDLFKDELLELDGLGEPPGRTTKKRMSEDLDHFLGSKVRVTYSGIFLIGQDERTAGSLIEPLIHGGDKNAKPRIEMTSASFDLVGFHIGQLSWRSAPKNRLRIELSFGQEVLINDEYLSAPIELFSAYFDLFVMGKRTDAARP